MNEAISKLTEIKGRLNMEKENFIKLAISSIGAYLSNKLGILFPILCILLFSMVADYIQQE